MNLSVLYRGILKSCNYKCFYCPFKPGKESKAMRIKDHSMLVRFVQWIKENTDFQFSILFTPSGEALLKSRYQQAIITLSHLPHVQKVAIQTNLSGNLEWIKNTNCKNLALWTTFHPDKVRRKDFLDKCQQLIALKIRFSVGMVGVRKYFESIKCMRDELPSSIYLWINAYKDISSYYSQQEIDWLTTIDPHFPINNMNHKSRGQYCKAGENVVSIDGYGQVWPCNFTRRSIGNIYKSNLKEILRKRTCENEFCNCYIGYVHLEYLKLIDLFGNGLLERIPKNQFWNDPMKN